MSDNLHVIVGLGITGLSCARFLHERGIPIAVNDTREAPPHLAALQKACPGITISLGKLDADLLARAAKIILSPGIALAEPLIAAQVARGIPVIGDIELFAQNVNVPVIAITGTNAKSTVTTLVGEMMAAADYRTQAGGNLGIPALDLLNETNDVYVLELSSFQLETTYSLRPKVATVLNISPDHMDRYKTVDDYRKAKHRVYQHCDVAVCNRDDKLTDTKVANRNIYFTLGEPAEGEFGLMVFEQAPYLAYGTRLLMRVSELPVPGKHYQANVLAALAIGYAFGLSLEPMLRVLRTFKGLPHRCQWVRELDGVDWYNDSKGTNVGATQAAIDGLGSEIMGKLVLIAGGVGKNADFSPLVPTIRQHVRHVVLIGEAAKDLAAVMKDEIDFSFANTMDDAVKEAARVAKRGDSVLLSPACASFDMFKNYEHRGTVFTEIVENL